MATSQSQLLPSPIGEEEIEDGMLRTPSLNIR